MEVIGILVLEKDVLSRQVAEMFRARSPSGWVVKPMRNRGGPGRFASPVEYFEDPSRSRLNSFLRLQGSLGSHSKNLKVVGVVILGEQLVQDVRLVHGALLIDSEGAHVGVRSVNEQDFLVREFDPAWDHKDRAVVLVQLWLRKHRRIEPWLVLIARGLPHKLQDSLRVEREHHANVNRLCLDKRRENSEGNMRGRFLFRVCPRMELVRLHDAHNLLSNHGRHNRRATRVNFRRKYTATREGPAQSLTLQGVCELLLECRHTRPPEPIMLSRVKRPARWHGLVPILLPSLDIDKKEGKAEEDIGPAGFADLCSAARQRPAPEDLGAEDSHLRDHQDETNGAPQSRRRELLEGAQGCFRRCSGLDNKVVQDVVDVVVDPSHAWLDSHVSATMTCIWLPRRACTVPYLVVASRRAVPVRKVPPVRPVNRKRNNLSQAAMVGEVHRGGHTERAAIEGIRPYVVTRPAAPKMGRARDRPKKPELPAGLSAS